MRVFNVKGNTMELRHGRWKGYYGSSCRGGGERGQGRGGEEGWAWQGQADAGLGLGD